MRPSVVENHQSVRECIREACERSGRSPDEVRLVAVSKTVGVEPIRQLHAAGQSEFGESRLQEAVIKIGNLPDDITWHFIGRLQKNKIRRIVSDFTFIHSVDSMETARYMDSVARESGRLPSVLLQVNLACENTKAGFGAEELKAFMPFLLALQGLKICGLMCIPPFTENSEDSRMYFHRLRELRDVLEKANDCSMPHLSMGMSHDFALAIEEGATFVRVGSLLFGERPHPPVPKIP